MPMSLHESLMLRLRQMAGLDLTERRLPQDGRLRVSQNGKAFELRLACIPTLFGESQTMRILDRNTTLLGLEKLGLTERELEQIRGLIHQPNGLLLAAGPVGSGKTTLLYSCLQEIAKAGTKTLTVEEFMEHALPYTTPIQVNKRAGLPYSAALRALMRHDPDVILIGELPDLETAQIAQMMALTGHLVLAPFQTHRAADAITRLLDLGIDPGVLAGTLLGVVVTRLVRTICTECKEPYPIDPGDPFIEHFARRAAAGGYEIPDDPTLYRGRGCNRCRQKGYRGRTGIHELLVADEAIAEAIMRRASAEEITDLALERGMVTFFADGVRKAFEGLTTLDEVRRVTAVGL
jgi:type IV pilus assembly protein PilB